MASKNCQYDLNTENCAMLNQISQEVYHIVRKNDEALARLTSLVDTKLRLPNIPMPEIAETESYDDNADADELTLPSSNTGEGLTNGNSASNLNGSNSPDISHLNEDNEEDELRGHLDTNLRLGSVPCDEGMFKNIHNRRIRQLLIDNHRLLLIKENKQKENHDLWRTYETYEHLISEIIIPKLSQDVNAGNIERIAATKEILTDQTFPLEDHVWIAYCEYIERLESVKLVTNKLVEFLQDQFHGEQVERLAAQLAIVENLIGRLKAGGLGRSKSGSCFPVKICE
ncbi:hypothetical protein METSCH_B04230 [Metschnikowia aff. pulcherrima]|uniref:Uncharacterized protein n=1 Tax=Metschnikowia aff. pulcherrima TaxID=2163413 RepID=A0A4V1ADX4_9ASCO|nr:hypothetical protein METSCH_B04230 [Metschnikowia aff. pulcherrima]